MNAAAPSADPPPQAVDEAVDAHDAPETDPQIDGARDADDLLVLELGRIAGLADPVPAGWVDTARAAFAWADLPGLPARLTYDSRSAGGRPSDALVGSAQRNVRFTAGAGPTRIEVEVELDIGADKLRLLGRLRPARRTSVVVVSTVGRVPASADETGTFRVDELPCRPFCVLVDGPQPVKTGWVVT